MGNRCRAGLDEMFDGGVRMSAQTREDGFVWRSACLATFPAKRGRSGSSLDFLLFVTHDVTQQNVYVYADARLFERSCNSHHSTHQKAMSERITLVDKPIGKAAD